MKERRRRWSSSSDFQRRRNLQAEMGEHCDGLREMVEHREEQLKSCESMR